MRCLFHWIKMKNMTIIFKDLRVKLIGLIPFIMMVKIVGEIEIFFPLCWNSN